MARDMASAMAALLIISCGKKEEEVVSVSSVAVSPVSVEITEGESTKLTAKVSPASAADRAVVWTSSDKAVATVDGNGNVQSIKAGTATITATAEGKSGKSTVTVKTKIANVTEVIDSYSITYTGIDKIIIPESVKCIRTRFFNESKTPLEIELNWKTKEDIDRISTGESDPSRFFFVRTDRSAVKVTATKGT